MQKHGSLYCKMHCELSEGPCDILFCLSLSPANSNENWNFSHRQDINIKWHFHLNID